MRQLENSLAIFYEVKYTREMKAYFQIEICPLIVITALDIIPKPGNNPNVFYRWMVRQIVVHIHTVEYNSTIKEKDTGNVD